MSRKATPCLYQVFGLCLLDSERQHRTRQGSSAAGREIGLLFSLGTLCMLRTHSTCAKLHAQPWKQSLMAVCVKHLAQKQPLLTALSYRVRAMLARKTADERLQSRSGYKRRDLLSLRKTDKDGVGLWCSEQERVPGKTVTGILPPLKKKPLNSWKTHFRKHLKPLRSVGNPVGAQSPSQVRLHRADQACLYPGPRQKAEK